jgi:L-methionine (R)-S-oxide reductase
MQATDNDLIVAQAAALFDGERDPIANAANLASLIGTSIDDLNWSGIYIMRKGELVLGPFYGRPACVRIALGKGVCGTAAQKRETIVVADVDAFPGHIACDPASKSEIVVPLISNGNVIGVLDIDSPVINRFSKADQELFEALAQKLVTSSNWPTQA